jgi:CDP-paratose 2-epimerase
LKILVTGICGFVGSQLAIALLAANPTWEIIGIDNFSRAGSWLNKAPLESMGIKIVHGDIRNASDVENLPQSDWVIDAAANPSVLAGVDGKTSSRQLVEHNLFGTINLLEYCKRHSAGFVLLSTSRVYSIEGLSRLKMLVHDDAFHPDPDQPFPDGITINGVNESFSTLPPVSLYGSTKVTSEHLALEYGETFGFPVWINRCGVLAGAGQFGHPAQGIFAYWIHSFREGRPLKYIGFGGEGHQVRDCLHPRDLIPLLRSQFLDTKCGTSQADFALTEDQEPGTKHQETVSRIFNVAGGIHNSMSLAQLTAWCTNRYPKSPTISSLPTAHCQPSTKHQAPSTKHLAPTNNLSEAPRPFDIPWMVLDSQLARDTWDWQPQTTCLKVCEEIAGFADMNPNWLSVTLR